MLTFELWMRNLMSTWLRSFIDIFILYNLIKAKDREDVEFYNIRGNSVEFSSKDIAALNLNNNDSGTLRNITKRTKLGLLSVNNHLSMEQTVEKAILK